LSVPLWFDPAIGYWTGEPDWDFLAATLERALGRWEIVEIVVTEEVGDLDPSPASWLPGGDAAGSRLMLVGRRAVWVATMVAAGHVEWAADAQGEALLCDWASDEGLGLTRENWPGRDEC
jgi:hypothetical protein